MASTVTPIEISSKTKYEVVTATAQHDGMTDKQLDIENQKKTEPVYVGYDELDESKEHLGLRQKFFNILNKGRERDSWYNHLPYPMV